MPQSTKDLSLSVETEFCKNRILQKQSVSAAAEKRRRRISRDRQHNGHDQTKSSVA